MQQQTVITDTVIVSQPRQPAPVVSSFANRQSTVIGILLIIFGALSILFNIADIAVGRYYYYTLSHLSNGVAGHGMWCGILVSLQSYHSYTALLGRPY